MTAAVVFGWLGMQDRRAAESAPSSPPAAPADSSGQLVPADLAEYDQQLVTELRSHGLSVTNPAMTARDAHLVCQHLQHGESVAEVKRGYTEASQGDARVADLFVTTVMGIYPSCP